MKRLIILFCLFAGTAANSMSPGENEELPSGPQGCSSFCLDNNGYAIFGANYDLVKNKHDGLVIVNKRNVTKSFQHLDSPGDHVRWTSKYGSVSFNFIASQTSWTGMNEAGLVIYSMRLEEGSKPPAPDQRQWISAHYWLQYMLDNFSTIEQVLASDSTLRVFSSGRIPHYLVSDRYGNCATIEFIDGKTVSHSGKNLPVKVLANTAYASSIAEWKNVTRLKKNRQPIPPTGTSSRGRFLRAVERVTAFQPTDSETAVKIAFDILKDLSRANTNWSIVYDTKNLQIHFKTIVHPAIRLIDMQQIDFSCQAPVKMIDINEKLAGDITDQLKDYTFEYHFDHALRAAKKYGLEMTADELMKYIRMIEAFPCQADSASTPHDSGQKPTGTELHLSTGNRTANWNHKVTALPDGREQRESNDTIAVTILYNNTSVNDSIMADHGFSCLIESRAHSSLFDAGWMADKFMTNVDKLGVDGSRIRQVFVSHIHGDHTGGLVEILARCNRPTLYLPFSYPQLTNEPHSDRAKSDFQAWLAQLQPLVAEIIRKKESIQVGDNFFSTGMIEAQTYEQALIIPTSKGLIIITGCAHPGILRIVRRAHELMKQDVYLVMGGFHLIRTDLAQVKTIAKELRKVTKYIGPCHCTGENAQTIFKDIFRNDYIDIQAGLKLQLGEGELK